MMTNVLNIATMKIQWKSLEKITMETYILHLKSSS
jgi:hypothetical protein